MRSALEYAASTAAQDSRHAFRFQAGDLRAGDVDTILMCFGEGDVLSFVANLSGGITISAGTSAGVTGVYPSVAVAGGCWFGWLPDQSVASVEAVMGYGVRLNSVASAISTAR